MFPTTAWTTIRAAAADDAARERFAATYRAPVVRFLRRKGWSDADAEDLCHEVFVRIFQNAVLDRADAARGRFRGLLLTMTRRVALDRQRRKQVPSAAGLDVATISDADLQGGADADADAFDGEWALATVERAMAELRREAAGYAGVLESHLRGEGVDRQKLWIARRKLAGLVRREIALTCEGTAQLEDELAHLARYLA